MLRPDPSHLSITPHREKALPIAKRLQVQTESNIPILLTPYQRSGILLMRFFGAPKESLSATDATGQAVA